MHNILQKRKILAFFSIATFSFTVNSQTQESSLEKLYNWHDSKIKVTEIFNGPIHTNQDRTIDAKNHRYFGKNEFLKGSVVYENQEYGNVLLKYDLTKDLVIFLPDQDNNLTTIELIKNYIDSFKIQNSKFVYLKNNKSISDGFFEEKLKTNKIVFYIKHKKESKDILKDKGRFIEYFTYKEYYIEKDKVFYKITNKRDLISLYPDLKQKIEDFFEMNKLSEKDNQSKILTSLVEYINNLLQSK